MKGTITLEELRSRGNEYPMIREKRYSFIYKVSKSELRPNIWILQFLDGTQANVTKDVYLQFQIEEDEAYVGYNFPDGETYSPV
jgi:hypothetical protein